MRPNKSYISNQLYLLRQLVQCNKQNLCSLIINFHIIRVSSSIQIRNWFHQFYSRINVSFIIERYDCVFLVERDETGTLPASSRGDGHQGKPVRDAVERRGTK